MAPRNEIEEFEKKLKLLVNKQIIKFPFDDEFLEELVEKEEEVELSEDFNERLLACVKNTMDKIGLMKRKLSNPEEVESLGKYLSYFRTMNDVSVSSIVEDANIELRVVQGIENESINPTEIPISEIAGLIQFLKLSFNDALSLLEKNLVLFGLKERGIVEEAYSRVDKTIKEAEKDRLMDNALKDLLVKVETETRKYHTEQLSLSFKHKLESELEKRGYHV